MDKFSFLFYMSIFSYTSAMSLRIYLHTDLVQVIDIFGVYFCFC